MRASAREAVNGVVLAGLLGSVAGASAAFHLEDGTTLTFTAGLASKEERHPMEPDDRMLAGSVGKTFFAAAALHLAHAKKLGLDDPAAQYLGDEQWYAALPHSREITVRHLLQHTSGLKRYVMASELWKRLLEERDKVWTVPELLAYLPAGGLFAPGAGWAYCDTGYLVLGEVLERVSGKDVYDYVRDNLLEPHGFEHTSPSDRRDLPALAQGYTA